MSSSDELARLLSSNANVRRDLLVTPQCVFTIWGMGILACIITIGFIYVGWPSLYEGCTPYTCNWINYGRNTTAWYAEINGYVSLVQWGAIYVSCDSEECAIGGYNSTTIPPYGDGTICFGPPLDCSWFGQPFWLLGWKCQPLLYCFNAARHQARLATTVSLSVILFFGVIISGLLLPRTMMI